MKTLREYIDANLEIEENYSAEELEVINEAEGAEERKYVVYQEGGYVGHIGNATLSGNPINVVAKELTKAEAIEKRKSMNKLLTPWERKHVGISYKLTEESKIKYNESK